MGIRKLHLLFFLFVLFLSACGGQKQNKLVLIVENAHNTDSIFKSANIQRYSRSIILQIDHYIHFIGSNGVNYMFVPYGASDTLTITTQGEEVLEIFCRYGRMRKEYLLLQAEDTVRLNFNGSEQPTYISHCKPAYTQLYRLQQELQAKSLFSDGNFMNELWKGYTFELTKRKFNIDISDDYTASAILEEQYYAGVARMEQAVDSVAALGMLPEAYKQYYQYHIAMQKVAPLKERQTMDTWFPPTPEQLAFFNDSCQNYISYRDYIYGCRMAYAKNGMEWEAPRFYDTRVLPPNVKSSWYPDQRATFDRLTEMQRSGDNRISAVTYDIMRYCCLDNICFTGMYPKEDSAVYIAKYKALTTNFLETETVSASSSWGFPFRLLLFVLQLNICICVFYSLYRLLLYNTTSFVACRVFLLSGIVLSLVVALRLITVDVIIPESVLQAGHKFRLAGWVVLGIYGLSAVYLLFRLSWQLYYIWMLRSDSWRIKDGSYLLCILKDIITTPGAFFRMVFISWGDYFEPSSRENRDRILSHEEYHVRNLHSVDVMLLMLLRFFCWFNPLFIKYMRELKQVDEYAADRSVVRRIG